MKHVTLSSLFTDPCSFHYNSSLCVKIIPKYSISNCNKWHAYVLINAIVFQSCYTVPLSLSALMLRYRWTVKAFCFKWLTLPSLQKLIFSLAHSSFLQFQLPFKLLAALRSRSCYCSTPSDLLTCGHITTSDAVPVWSFTLYFCRLLQNVLHSSYLILMVVDPPNVVAMSMSLRGLCVCLLSTWQHWISIGTLSTHCRLTVHLGSAHCKGIYLDIVPHSSLQDLN